MKSNYNLSLFFSVLLSLFTDPRPSIPLFSPHQWLQSQKMGDCGRPESARAKMTFNWCSDARQLLERLDKTIAAGISITLLLPYTSVASLLSVFFPTGKYVPIPPPLHRSTLSSFFPTTKFRLSTSPGCFWGCGMYFWGGVSLQSKWTMNVCRHQNKSEKL